MRRVKTGRLGNLPVEIIVKIWRLVESSGAKAREALRLYLTRISVLHYWLMRRPISVAQGVYVEMQMRFMRNPYYLIGEARSIFDYYIHDALRDDRDKRNYERMRGFFLEPTTWKRFRPILDYYDPNDP